MKGEAYPPGEGVDAAADADEDADAFEAAVIAVVPRSRRWDPGTCLPRFLPLLRSRADDDDDETAHTGALVAAAVLLIAPDTAPVAAPAAVIAMDC